MCASVCVCGVEEEEEDFSPYSLSRERRDSATRDHSRHSKRNRANRGDVAEQLIRYLSLSLSPTLTHSLQRSVISSYASQQNLWQFNPSHHKDATTVAEATGQAATEAATTTTTTAKTFQFQWQFQFQS